METFLKYLGVIILLIGVVFLVVYNFTAQANWMLIVGLVTELVGIATYVLVNKYLD